jgi:putative transposase of IS4/5 family DUF4096
VGSLSVHCRREPRLSRRLTAVARVVGATDDAGTQRQDHNRRVRTGTPWRDVPDCYGHWRSVYGLYRRWQRDGTWARILSALQGRADAVGLITWDVSVDSTIARVHQHAAGARKRPDAQVEPPGDEPDDHALGRSRGGWTTKLHLACEQGRKTLAFVVTGGQRGDSPQFTTVLWRIRVPFGPRRMDSAHQRGENQVATHHPPRVRLRA